MPYHVIYLIGYLGTKLIDEVILFIIPIMIFLITKDVSKSGMLFCLEWITRLIVISYIGSIADRMGSKILIIISEITRFLLFLFLLYVFLIFRSFTFVSLLILSIGFSTIFEISYISNEMFIGKAFINNYLTIQNTTQQIDQIIKIVSPLIAIMFNSIFIFWLVLLAIFPIINTIIIMYYDENQNIRPYKHSNHSPLFSGIKLLLTNKSLLPITVIVLFINFFYGMVYTTFSYYIIDIFLMDKTVIYILAFITAVIILFTLHSVSECHLTKNNFLCSTLICLASYILLGLGNNIYLYSISFVIFSLCAALLSLFIRFYRIRTVGNEHLGKIIGAMLILNSLSIPLAGFLVSLFGKTSLVEIFLCSGLIFLLVLIIVSYFQLSTSSSI